MSGSRALRTLAESIDWADKSPITWASLREKIEKAADLEENYEYEDRMGDDM
jgi:hypothetical protein